MQTSVADSADLMYTYSSGNLSSVKRTDSSNSAQTYGFTYDAFGNMLTAKVGSRTLVTNTYGTGNGLLTKQTYGNGDSVSYTYDNLGRVKTTSYPDWSVFTYCYNGEGRLHSAEQNDQNNIYTYLYNYDSLGRLISSEKLMDGDPILQESQTYNSNNQLTSTGWRVDGESFSEQYTYNASDGSLNTITMSSGDTLTMGYDGLRRLSSMSGGLGARSYSYNDKTASATTLQVKSITYPELGNLTFTYTYDSNGNIATYTAPGKGTITYTYDDMGQLTGATGGEGYSYSYGYDDVGNITSISDPFVDTVLPYESGDWKDLISEYVTYDEIGNPLFYMNGISWMDLTWRAGRLLASADAGDGTIFFAYDINGLRTAKMTYGTTYEYVYSGDKLLRQTWETTDDGEFWYFNSIDFFYDGNGTPYAMKYNGEMYYYVTNLQGDVIMIVDSTGATVAEYEYSPYGKVLSSAGELSYINPLRYRGYVYDEETGFYYLQSRYYDPAIGRFLNADAYASTGQGMLGYNMFTYCGNNPVCCTDESGTSWIHDLRIAANQAIWKLGAAFLKAVGYQLTGNLLQLAASGQDNKYCATADSNVSQLIASNKGFVNEVLENYNSTKSGMSNNPKELPGYTFPVAQGDLGAALHTVTYSYKPFYNSATQSQCLYVTVMDTFDFTEVKNPFVQGSFKAGMLWAANDIAYVDMQLGILNPVSVEIIVIIPINP